MSRCHLDTAKGFQKDGPLYNMPCKGRRVHVPIARACSSKFKAHLRFGFIKPLKRAKKEGEFMKKAAIILFMIITLCSCSKEYEVSKVDKEQKTPNIVKFNKISLDIPKDWTYNVDPKAKPGVDQLQLYCKTQEKGTLLITVANAREGVSLTQVVTEGGKIFVQRALSMPGFSDCLVEGTGEEPEFMGRKGILVSFNLIKQSKDNNKDVAMKIYNFGEELKETNEVLLITTYNTTEDYTDMEKIIKSMKMLSKQ